MKIDRLSCDHGVVLFDCGGSGLSVILRWLGYGHNLGVKINHHGWWDLGRLG